MTTLATTFLAALLLGGCSIMPTGDPDPSLLDGTAWILSELPGRTLAPGPAAVTLRFADGNVQGSDGCNRYSAPYRATGGKLEISSRGVSTMMACAPELMQQATVYTAALNGARAWRIEGRQLTLAADGRALASFTAQDTSLAGTSWRVTGINNGKQAVVSVLSGTSVTLTFAADRRATGSAGCNTFNATYESDGTRLRFGQAATTRKMCAGKGAMDQELAFVRVLQTITTARIEGNRLELRTANGALAVSATRE